MTDVVEINQRTLGVYYGINKEGFTKVHFASKARKQVAGWTNLPTKADAAVAVKQAVTRYLAGL